MSEERVGLSLGTRSVLLTPFPQSPAPPVSVGVLDGGEDD